VAITEEAASGLVKIVDGIKKVNDLVAEISAASNEQANGIEQVNTAVMQMNKVTQQNASNSEESASASEELNSQAEELSAMVGTFILSNAGHRPKAAARRIAAPVRKPAPKPAKLGSGKKVMKPEEVIPLDDADFADF